MAPWRIGGRYQVWRAAPVQTLAGDQLVLPMGFAEVEPMQPGFRIRMPLEHVRGFCCKDLALVAGHRREDEMASQAAIWNSPAMNSA